MFMYVVCMCHVCYVSSSRNFAACAVSNGEARKQVVHDNGRDYNNNHQANRRFYRLYIYTVLGTGESFISRRSNHNSE